MFNSTDDTESERREGVGTLGTSTVVELATLKWHLKLAILIFDQILKSNLIYQKFD